MAALMVVNKSRFAILLSENNLQLSNEIRHFYKLFFFVLGPLSDLFLSTVAMYEAEKFEFDGPFFVVRFLLFKLLP